MKNFLSAVIRNDLLREADLRPLRGTEAFSIEFRGRGLGACRGKDRASAIARLIAFRIRTRGINALGQKMYGELTPATAGVVRREIEPPVIEVLRELRR